jgi:hypothetical protein
MSRVSAPQHQRVNGGSPRGRPSVYTRETGEAICERLADGESLLKICRDPGIPSRGVVMSWITAPDPTEEIAEFQVKYKRARAAWVEGLAHEVVDVADEATDRDSAAVAAVRLKARTWITGKLVPETYGDAPRDRVLAVLDVLSVTPLQLRDALPADALQALTSGGAGAEERFRRELGAIFADGIRYRALARDLREALSPEAQAELALGVGPALYAELGALLSEALAARRAALTAG